MHSSTLCRTFPPLLRPRQPLHRERQPLNTSVRAQTASSSGSYDSEGDDFLREFQQYADPNRLQNVTKRLELTWSVDRRRRPAPCDCCEGTGQKECTWCRGTGAMMVGEERFCSLAHGCKQCPICKSKHFISSESHGLWIEPAACYEPKSAHNIEHRQHGIMSQQASVQGHVGCDHCKGTGFRAGWMEPGCPA